MKQKVLLVLGLFAVLALFAFLADVGYTSGFVTQEHRDIYGRTIVKADVYGSACPNRCSIGLTNSGYQVGDSNVYFQSVVRGCDSLSDVSGAVSLNQLDMVFVDYVCDLTGDYYQTASGEINCFDEGDVVLGDVRPDSMYIYECSGGSWAHVMTKKPH